ncbi:hypothetical protein JCM11491_004647 [Sporobolomyces phaffii]
MDSVVSDWGASDSRDSRPLSPILPSDLGLDDDGRRGSKWPTGGFDPSWMDQLSPGADDSHDDDEISPSPDARLPGIGPRQRFTPIPRGPLDPLLPERFNSPAVFLDSDRAGYAVTSIALGTLDDRTFEAFTVERDVAIENGKLAMYSGKRGGGGGGGGLDLSGYGFDHSPAFHIRFLPGSVRALYFVRPGTAGDGRVEHVTLVVSTVETPVFRASVSARADFDETATARVSALDRDHLALVPYLSRDFLVRLAFRAPRDVFNPRESLPATFDNFEFDLAQLEAFPHPLDLDPDRFVEAVGLGDGNGDYSRRAVDELSTALGEVDRPNLAFALAWIAYDATLRPRQVVALVDDHVAAWDATAGYDDDTVDDVVYELRTRLVEKRHKRFQRFQRGGYQALSSTSLGDDDDDVDSRGDSARFEGLEGEAEAARKRVIERRDAAAGEGSSRLIPTTGYPRSRRRAKRGESLEERGKRNLYWMKSVVVTPSGTIKLQGKSVEKTNSIIRSNFDGVDHFLRVAFKEEDGLVLSTVGGVDALYQHELVEGSITRILKEGLVLGGRKFELLSYSQASLREAAAVFLAPFPSSIVRNGVRQTRLIDAAHVRRSMGHFEKVSRQPAMLGARWSQSFTTTSASVVLRDSQIHEIRDLSEHDEGGNETTCHTDGAGLLSPGLRGSICETLIANGYRLSSTAPYPSVFQFRLGGYKGVLAVDNTQEGIGIAVRPSQEKFSGIADDDDGTSFVLNIAEAFDRPRPLRLNRPLISALEDLGIDPSVFLGYQRRAVAAVDLPRDGRIFRFAHRQLVGAALGGPSGFQQLLRSFARLDHALPPALLSDEPFLREALDLVRTRILRSYKFHASIPLPDCYLVVGVPDEDGTLAEDEVYLAVRDPRLPDVVTYVQGRIAITRSPTVDAGDVRIVRAIGPPKDDGSRLHALENCVVLPTKGERSLASMMGGGDLDGAFEQIITLPDLIPDKPFPPASHRANPPVTLDRPATIDDVADCFVHHLENNLVGSIATKHLFVSDKSPLHGRDPIALKLAELHRSVRVHSAETSVPTHTRRVHGDSHSVDSPKTGRVVRNDDLPTFPDYLRRERPDFLQGESRDYALDTGYYRSERALGQLYRDIDFEQLRAPELEETTGPARDGASAAFGTLRTIVEDRLAVVLGSPRVDDEPDLGSDDESIVRLRSAFCSHLRDLSIVHSFPRTGGRGLTEVEMFAVTHSNGTTTTRDPVARGNAVVAMGTELESLVEWLKRELGPGQKGIARAQEAWRFGLGRETDKWDDEFGVRTFRWMCLSILLDRLDRLEEAQEEGTANEAGSREEAPSLGSSEEVDERSRDHPPVPLDSSRPPSVQHSPPESIAPSPSPFPLPPNLCVPESIASSYLNPRRLQQPTAQTRAGPRSRSAFVPLPESPAVRPPPRPPSAPLSGSTRTPDSSTRAQAPVPAPPLRSTQQSTRLSTLSQQNEGNEDHDEGEGQAVEGSPDPDPDPWQTERLIRATYSARVPPHHYVFSRRTRPSPRATVVEVDENEEEEDDATTRSSRSNGRTRRLERLRQRKGKINVSSGDEFDTGAFSADDDEDDDDGRDETSDEEGMPLPTVG